LRLRKPYFPGGPVEGMQNYDPLFRCVVDQHNNVRRSLSIPKDM
jgi:hypothetical protein